MLAGAGPKSMLMGRVLWALSFDSSTMTEQLRFIAYCSVLTCHVMAKSSNAQSRYLQTALYLLVLVHV